MTTIIIMTIIILMIIISKSNSKKIAKQMDTSKNMYNYLPPTINDCM